jgi:hypothetical protein
MQHLEVLNVVKRSNWPYFVNFNLKTEIFHEINKPISHLNDLWDGPFKISQNAYVPAHRDPQNGPNLFIQYQ